MKKIICIILFINIIFASESQYPIEFSFEEDSLFLSHLSLNEDDNNKTVLSIIFNNNKDNILILVNSIVEIPNCNINTMYELENILYSHLPLPCKRAFNMHGQRYKKILLDKFTILLYKNNTTNNKELDLKTAFIFKEGMFIATMMSNMKNDEFKNLLFSLKENIISSREINIYINQFNRYLSKGYLNTSFKKLVSAFILDPKNRNLQNLYHKLMKAKSTKINMLDNFYYKWKSTANEEVLGDANATKEPTAQRKNTLK